MGLFDRRVKLHAHDIEVALPLLRLLVERLHQDPNASWLERGEEYPPATNEEMLVLLEAYNEGGGPGGYLEAVPMGRQSISQIVLDGESLAVALRGEDGWPPGVHAAIQARGIMNVVPQVAYQENATSTAPVLVGPSWIEDESDDGVTYFDLGGFIDRCSSACLTGKLAPDDLFMSMEEALAQTAAPTEPRGQQEGEDPTGPPQGQGWGCWEFLAETLREVGMEARRLRTASSYSGPDARPFAILAVPDVAADTLKTDFRRLPPKAIPSKKDLGGWQKTARVCIQYLKDRWPEDVADYVGTLDSDKDRKLIESM